MRLHTRLRPGHVVVLRETLMTPPGCGWLAGGAAPSPILEIVPDALRLWP
ncbi:MAG: hypothetical protein MUE82_11710 [Chloroflexi bacterium]|nr:hypothetical protein [Chloroflexota bacterium]